MSSINNLEIESLVKSGRNLEELALEHTINSIGKEMSDWDKKLTVEKKKHPEKITILTEYCQGRIDLLTELFLHLKNNN